MADDVESTGTHKIVRVTEEELECSSESDGKSGSSNKDKSRRYSRSRVDRQNSQNDSEGPKSGRQKKDVRARNRDIVDEAVPTKDGISEGSDDVKSVASRNNETTGKTVRKERVREGFGIYQVKKGKYSEKVGGKEEFATLTEQDRNRRISKSPKNPVSRKSFEKAKQENLEDGKTGQKKPINRKSEHKIPQRKSIETSEVPSNQGCKNFKRRSLTEEDWDLEKENTTTEQGGSNLRYEKDYRQPERQKSVEENWDISANSAKDLEIEKTDSEIKDGNCKELKSETDTRFNTLNDEKQIVKLGTDNVSDNFKEEKLDNSIDKKENKESKSNKIIDNNEKEKEVPEVNEIDSKVVVKKNGELAEKVPRRGVGRGKRLKEVQKKDKVGGLQEKSKVEIAATKSPQRKNSKEVKKHISNEKFSKNVSSSVSSEMKVKKNESEQEKARQEKQATDVRRKVPFVNNEHKEVLQNKHEESKKENEKRKAGIIVLPSSNVLDQNQAENTKENPTRSTKMANGFSKLERPANFDPNRSRGKAKLCNDEKRHAISRNDNLEMPSSGEEIWKKIKSECSKMKKQLSKKSLLLDDIEKVLELSTLLQDLYKELIVKHQDFSFKNDVEGSLWKNTFYNVITRIRTLIDENSNDPHFSDIFQFYWNFLQDCDDFLQDLLSSLQEECKFDLDAFVENPLKMAGCKKQVKLGIRSCHLILLNLGDLERYITDLQQDSNYSKANDNYHKAQMLAPKNGKSYNQLAVVAVKSKKKLDAVFYYIRSLEASSPIESGRERLTGIFHEIKKKADFTKKESLKKSIMTAPAQQPQLTAEEVETFRNDYSKEDIWVFYRSGQYYKVTIGANGRILESANDGKQEEEGRDVQDKISLREANKQFLIYYLYMHSKLYTRIGFEHVMTVYEDALQSFKLLLNHHKASSVKKENLVKFMAINIFAIDNLVKKQENGLEVLKDSPIDVAIIFGMDMTGLIAQHCVKLIDDYDNQRLDQFLPAVHTWIKWMCANLDLVKFSSVCYMKDIWDNIVGLLNAIRGYCIQNAEECKDGEPVGLFEDLFLSGFQPLFEMENPSMKVLEEDKRGAERLVRLENLKILSYIISESRKLPVVFNDETKLFDVITPKTIYESPTKNGPGLLLDEAQKDIEDNDSDVIIEDVLEDIDPLELQNLKYLKARKVELTAKLRDHAKRDEEREAIVKTNASQVHVISENHPQFIVPDTNCFIDNLEGLLKIIDSKDFTVILPLVVVNELDGLKKGKDLLHKCPDQTNAIYVKEKARLAMETLENRFSERDSQLKALTSVGTELDSIAFRNEELSQDKGKNDDIILSCCLHYCEESVDRFSTDVGPMRLQRKVVLLTDDRNLRLKAHSRQVPTLSLNIFLKMAHLV